jgi:hypothetical protein
MIYDDAEARVTRLVHACPALEELDIDDVSFREDLHVGLLRNNLPQLRILSLASCSPLNAAFFAGLARFSLLTELVLVSGRQGLSSGRGAAACASAAPHPLAGALQQLAQRGGRKFRMGARQIRRPRAWLA